MLELYEKLFDLGCQRPLALHPHDIICLRNCFVKGHFVGDGKLVAYAVDLLGQRIAAESVGGRMEVSGVVSSRGEVGRIR